MHRSDTSDPRGTVWAWCDSRGGYAHYGVVVPAWWSNPGFVDEDRLDSFVDYPDSISGLIDDWIGALLDGTRDGAEGRTWGEAREDD
jgi:hypothetical protein